MFLQFPQVWIFDQMDINSLHLGEMWATIWDHSFPCSEYLSSLTGCFLFSEASSHTTFMWSKGLLTLKTIKQNLLQKTGEQIYYSHVLAVYVKGNALLVNPSPSAVTWDRPLPPGAWPSEPSPLAHSECWWRPWPQTPPWGAGRWWRWSRLHSSWSCPPALRHPRCSLQCYQMPYLKKSIHLMK